MNRIVACIPVIALLAGTGAVAAPALTPQQCNDYPFVRTNGPLTHSQVVNELAELEAAGYNPALGEDWAYPEDLQAAQRRLWDEYAADCPTQPAMADAPNGMSPVK
jgi:hypothetical protein